MQSVGNIQFASFDLDPMTAEVWHDGVKLHLQEKPFQLLLALLERPGEVVTREELRSRLWSDHAFGDFDHSLNVAVSKLRDSLGDSAVAPRLIETVPRRGYRFHVPVRDEQARESRRSRVARWLWAALLLTLSALVVLFVRVRRDRVRTPSAASGEEIRSLAVLPLKDNSQVSGQPYMADGITAAIIAELGKIHALRVVSWQSVVQFRDSEATLPEIAYLLDVDAILLGSVLRSDNRIRVSVQLFALRPERQLWAESYEEDLGDLLGLQESVARAAAQEIRVTVTPEEESRLAANGPVHKEGLASYFLGLHHWNRFSGSAFRQAVGHFEEAIALDPTYAPAHSALADSWSMLGYYGHVPPRQAFPQAEKAARRALELDPGLAAAHNSLAIVLYGYRWNFRAADRHHRQAIRLNPSLAMAHGWYSWSLADQARHEEALASILRAQGLDPLSLVINTTVGIRLHDARRHEEAIQTLLHVLEMNQHFSPALLFLGLAYQEVGRYEEAVEALREAVAASAGKPIYEAALASGYAKAGRRQDAEAALARLLVRSGEEYVSAYHIAAVMVALDRIDDAFDWLERALAERSPWMCRLGGDPLFDPIRSDDRLRELLRRLRTENPGG